MSEVLAAGVWLALLREDEGAWTRSERTLLAVAQQLARDETAEAGEPNARWQVLCVGAPPAPGAPLPAGARIAHVTLPVPVERAAPNQLAELLHSLSEAAPVTHVILGHDYRAFELLAPLAARLEGCAVPDVIGWRHAAGRLRLRRPCYGGRLEADVELPANGRAPVVLSVRPEAFAGATTEWCQETWSGDRDATESSALTPAEREWRGCEESSGTGVDLTAAERIVSVGRGLGDPTKLEPIRRLAQALHAELAGSRPVIDNGWLSEDRQVGSSGQTVAPRLYLALGISGASQHLAGMSGSQCLVAINQDRDAPIFRWARFGIAGDLHTLAPALTEAASATESEGSDRSADRE